MFNFLKKLSSQDALKVRAVLNAIKSMLTFSLLLWIIYSFKELNWIIIVPLVIVGVVCNIWFSLAEDNE